MGAQTLNYAQPTAQFNTQFNTLPYNYGMNYAQPQYSQFNYGYQQQYQPLRAAAPLYTPSAPIVAAPAAAPVATPLYTATAPVATVAQPMMNNYYQPRMNYAQPMMNYAQPAYNTV